MFSCNYVSYEKRIICNDNLVTIKEQFVTDNRDWPQMQGSKEFKESALCYNLPASYQKKKNVAGVSTLSF